MLLFSGFRGFAILWLAAAIAIQESFVSFAQHAPEFEKCQPARRKSECTKIARCPAVAAAIFIRSGQEVCFGPSRPDPGRNARDQDGTRTGRDGPHFGTWMGPKHCKTKHMANLDGTTWDPGWDLDGPRIGPGEGLDGTPRDSNRLLGLADFTAAYKSQGRPKTTTTTISGTKKEPKPKLLSPIFSGGRGVFHMNGWGPKSSVCPSKPGKSNFLGGISRDFAGISRRCPKSLRKKSLCSIFVPYHNLPKKFCIWCHTKRNLMTHQMKNLCGFSVFHCLEGPFGASSGGTPKMKKWGPARWTQTLVVVVVGPSLKTLAQFLRPQDARFPCDQKILGWHICRAKFARKILFELRISLRKMLRKFAPIILSLFSAGPKKPENSCRISHIIAQGEKIASEQWGSLRPERAELIPSRSPCYTRVCSGKKSLANGDARFWCTQRSITQNCVHADDQICWQPRSTNTGFAAISPFLAAVFGPQ